MSPNKNRWLFLRVTSIGLLLATAPSAGAADWLQTCKNALLKVSGNFTLWGSDIRAPWLRDSDFNAKLEKRLSEYLEEIRPGAEKFLKALPRGSSIFVNGIEYKVVSFLGDGYEGSVYLADGPLGRRTLKKFKGTTNIRTELNALEQMASRGVPTPKVRIIDEASQIAVLDYIEGLPIKVLLDASSRSPFTSAERNKIQKHFDEFKHKVQPLWPKFKDQNIIMDIRTGQFYVIDVS